MCVSGLHVVKMAVSENSSRLFEGHDLTASVTFLRPAASTIMKALF